MILGALGCPVPFRLYRYSELPALYGPPNPLNLFDFGLWNPARLGQFAFEMARLHGN